MMLRNDLGEQKVPGVEMGEVCFMPGKCFNPRTFWIKTMFLIISFFIGHRELGQVPLLALSLQPQLYSESPSLEMCLQTYRSTGIVLRAQEG